MDTDLIVEYMGMACPKCLKPIHQPKGSTDPKFCPHDNSGWAVEYRDPLDVFELDDKDWVAGFPDGGQVVGE